MKRARAVIGANFGDEGKGLIVDHLCATDGAGMVVRFNGGAQAGHTVVTPHGKRHVFRHVGAGAFEGVPTYLSEFFVVNPLLFLREVDELNQLGVAPTVYAHPKCLVSTFADMVINQRLEQARGKARHGSVGVGVSETIERSDVDQLKITMADVWNGDRTIERRLHDICHKWTAFRTGRPIPGPDAMIAAFLRALEATAERMGPLGIEQCDDPVFEGAQGLLLDQNNKEFFPHLTRSNTGMRNVRALCAQAGIDEVEAYYVTRTYLTRHGAGPLPGEDPIMRFSDDTNLENEFQGLLRFAPLDVDKLVDRVAADFGPGGGRALLAVTHCDQLAPPDDPVFNLYAGGPTRSDVSTKAKEWA